MAIDERRGIANEHGRPWQGKLPTDLRHFREATQHGIVVMGYRTYEEEFARPLSDRRNLVATHTAQPLRPGFEALNDVEGFLRQTTEDVWIIGGAGLFASSLSFADELDITKLQGNFACTKFFPTYETDFNKIFESEPIEENGITFQFTRWLRKA